MNWNIFGKHNWPSMTLDDIRKRSKIVVVDDMDFVYLSLFIKDGYSMDKWDDVDDLQKLESGYYDLILLDIQGVGKAHSKEQGLGILKHLRQVNPAQIVIAYSNADFSLEYQDFFHLADGTLPKSADYVEFKRAVDRLLEQRFSPDFYIDRVTKIASPHMADVTKLRELTSSAILKGKKKKLETYLNSHVEEKEAISLILQVVQTGLSIAALSD